MNDCLLPNIMKKKITKQFLMKSHAADADVSNLMKLLDIDAYEAVLLIMIFQYTVEMNYVYDTKEIKERFGLTNTEYFSLLDRLQHMGNRGILRVSGKGRAFMSVDLPEEITEMLVSGNSPYEKMNISNPFEWLDRFSKVLKKRKRCDLELDTFYSMVERDLRAMSDSIIAKSFLLECLPIERALYLYVLQSYLSNNEGVELKDFIDDVLDEEQSFNIQNNLEAVFPMLFNNNLFFKDNKAGYRNRVEITIYPSDEAVKLMCGEKFISDRYSSIDFKNVHSVSGYVDNLYGQLSGNRINESMFNAEMRKIFEMMGESMPLKKYMKQLKDYEINILILCVNAYLKDGEGMALSDTADTIFKDRTQRHQIAMSILHGDMKIIKDGYVETFVKKGFFASNSELIMTARGIRELLKIEPYLSTIGNAVGFIVQPEKRANNLYFSEELSREFSVLSTALSAGRYGSLSSDLKKKGFGGGFVCLFYGAPGTGKTAACKEIARTTKRSILQVDIANVRDMYVGESEKRLKKVFDEYYAMKKEMKNTPILLFNEADALIGRRVDVQKSSDQLNNTMQNILLEELEKFDGIFMATTNLVENMDDAFSRRFLYKINFKNPDAETRKQIWKKYMPDIDDETLEAVVKKELSGGQIENIAKKYIVEKAIKKGYSVSLSEIINTEAGFKKSDTILGFK